LSIEENGSIPNENLYGIDRDDEFGMLSNNIQNMKNKLDSYSNDLEKEVKIRSNALEKAYKAIKTNEIKLNRLFRNIPVGIFSLNSDLNYVTVNKYFLELFGCGSFKEFELFYKSNEAGIFESENVKKHAESEYRSQGTLDVEVKLKKITGELFWVNLIVYKIDDDFQLSDSIAEGIIVNIQDKKDHELELVKLATTS